MSGADDYESEMLGRPSLDDDTIQAARRAMKKRRSTMEWTDIAEETLALFEELFEEPRSEA